MRAGFTVSGVTNNVASQEAKDGMAQQMNQVVTDIKTSAAGKRCLGWPGLRCGEACLVWVVLYDYLSHPGVQFADFHPGVKAGYTQVSRPLDVFPVRFQFVAVAKLVE